MRLFPFALSLTLLLSSTITFAQEWPSVSAELPPAGGGELDAAVVVGISKYVFLPEVPGAVENATSWAQYFVRTRKIPSARVMLLRDAEASKERMEGALRTAVAAAKAGGKVWFIFIGHGSPAPGGDDGLILGVDTQSDIESLAARGVPQRRVTELLERGPGTGVAVFDACFSGRNADGSAPLVRGIQATVPVRKALKSMVTVLSSSETFAGPLPGVDRPAFSYVLLGALRGWGDADGDTAVTVDEAIGFSRESLQASLKGAGRLPNVRGGKPGLVLATNVSERAPDVDAIVVGRCPDGARWDGSRCEAIPCPAGTKWTGSVCKATSLVVACPQGMEWNGRQCAHVAVSCPEGSRWDGARCVATAIALSPPPPPDDWRREPAKPEQNLEPVKVAMATPTVVEVAKSAQEQASAPVVSLSEGAPGLGANIDVAGFGPMMKPNLVYGGGTVLGLGVVSMGLGALPRIMIAFSQGGAATDASKSLKDAAFWQGWYDTGVVEPLIVGGIVSASAGAAALIGGWMLDEEPARPSMASPKNEKRIESSGAEE